MTSLLFQSRRIQGKDASMNWHAMMYTSHFKTISKCVRLIYIFYFFMMCHVLVWWYFVENISNFVLVLFPHFFKLLCTIPVTPITTAMTKHFMFHFSWISVLRFLYFNLFSASYCITFLNDGIATSLNKHFLSSLFLTTYYVRPLC
jgi:hypothetical protein